MTTPTTVNLLQRSLCREMFEKWRGGDMFFGEKVSQYPLNQSMQHMDKWQINAAQQKLFVCLHLSVFYSVESVGSMGTMRSIRSQRVRHNWMTFTFIQYTILCIIIYSFFFFFFAIKSIIYCLHFPREVSMPCQASPRLRKSSKFWSGCCQDPTGKLQPDQGAQFLDGLSALWLHFLSAEAGLWTQKYFLWVLG